MTDETRIAELWRWVFITAQERSPDWCTGCGYYRVVNDHHRADCTAGRRADCACGEPLLHPESIKSGRCLECRYIARNRNHTDPVTPVEAIYGGPCECGTGFLARHDSGRCEWCTAAKTTAADDGGEKEPR